MKLIKKFIIVIILAFGIFSIFYFLNPDTRKENKNFVFENREIKLLPESEDIEIKKEVKKNKEDEINIKEFFDTGPSLNRKNLKQEKQSYTKPQFKSEPSQKNNKPEPKEYLIFTQDEILNEIIVLDKNLNLVKRIKVEPAPHDITFSPDKKFIATSNFKGDSVTIIDPKSLKIIKTIHTGKGAHGVYFSRDSKFLFAVNAKEGTLSIIETFDFLKQRKIKIGGFPEYVGVTKDNEFIFVSDLKGKGSFDILKQNGFSSYFIKKIDIGYDPHGFCFSPSGKNLSVVNLSSEYIYIVDSKNFEILKKINTGSGSEWCTFYNETILFVSNIKNCHISIIDINNKKIEEIFLNAKPHGISFSPDKKFIFTSTYNTGEVILIDAESKNIIKRKKVGKKLHNLVVIEKF